MLIILHSSELAAEGRPAELKVPEIDKITTFVPETVAVRQPVMYCVSGLSVLGEDEDKRKRRQQAGVVSTLCVH